MSTYYYDYDYWATEWDANGDGISETIAYDFDDDGWVDAWDVDTDFDGYTDEYYYDWNEDGYDDYSGQSFWDPYGDWSGDDTEYYSYSTASYEPADSQIDAVDSVNSYYGDLGAGAGNTVNAAPEAEDSAQTTSFSMNDGDPSNLNADAMAHWDQYQGDGANFGEELVDADGDGDMDYSYSDEDGDGYRETLNEDTDGDGWFEQVSVDRDGDGFVDTVYTDTDGDDSVDQVQTDLDGDGVSDVTTMM